MTTGELINALKFIWRHFSQNANMPSEGNPKTLNTGGPKLLNNESTLSEKFQELYARYAIPFERFNIFGIRDNSGIDTYNDYIGIVTANTCTVFPATTDPGVYWSKNINRLAKGWPRGAAHLCLGYYRNVYAVGLHQGYEALVQRGPVKIWRDIDENYTQSDNEKNESGYYGINIHKGTGKTIGRDGAGCQVIQGAANFNTFMGIVKNSDEYRKNRNHLFSYMLWDKSQINFMRAIQAAI